MLGVSRGSEKPKVEDPVKQMLGDSSNPLAEQTQRMVSGGFYGPGSGT